MSDKVECASALYVQLMAIDLLKKRKCTGRDIANRISDPRSQQKQPTRLIRSRVTQSTRDITILHARTLKVNTLLNRVHLTTAHTINIPTKKNTGNSNIEWRVFQCSLARIIRRLRVKITSRKDITPRITCLGLRPTSTTTTSMEAIIYP